MSSVKDMSIEAYLEALGSRSAVPGGGSAAALAGAMGAALVQMVALISARKASAEADRQALTEAVPELESLRAQLTELSQLDIDAYRGVIEARKQHAGDKAVQRATEEAARVPLETARAVIRVKSIAGEVATRAWTMTASDLEAGRGLLQTALKAALANVAANLPDLQEEARVRISRAYRELGGE